MNDDTVGVIFLGASGVFTLIGSRLAAKGLNAVEEVADKAKQTTDDAQRAIARAQETATREGGANVLELAQTGTDVAEAQSGIQDAVSEVHTALSKLTGRLAPARVAFGMAFLCLLVSIAAFGIVSVDFEAGDSTTPNDARQPAGSG